MADIPENRRPDAEMRDSASGLVISRKTLGFCKEFLASMGQTVKLMGLYKPGHPVPNASLEETWRLLRKVFSSAVWGSMTLTKGEGRFLVNGAVLSDSSPASEAMLSSFRERGLDSVTFNIGAHLYELSALCEIAGMKPGDLRDRHIVDLLKQRGVKNITVNVDQYAKIQDAEPEKPKPRPKPKVRSPLRKAPPAPSPSARGEGGPGFGGFIKNLVDQSVSDPTERAAVYAEAVRMVKGALQRRVSEATREIRLEKQFVSQERDRTEQVFSSVAVGKVTVDKQGRILMMDAAAENIIGKKLVDVSGQPILDHVDGTEQMASLSRDIGLEKGQTPVGSVQVSGGEDVVNALRNAMAVVQDEHGRVVGTYGVLPAAQKYREAQKLQEDFAAHMTHELKAPLAAIISALELIEETVASKLGPTERKFLDIGRRNSTRLRDMINEILDFSKLHSGGMSVRPVPVSVAEMVHEAVESLRPWASSRKIALTAKLDSLGVAAATVMADYNRIVQVLTNLISNAVKATPEGGHIWVAAVPGRGEMEGSAVLFVKDTGKGIPPEEQRIIFERFKQAGGTGGYKEGVGLGLFIAKELVALHGGSIWLESELDKGTSFFFSLPISVPAADAAPANAEASAGTT